MEKEYILALIGIGGTVIGTILGFMLNIIYERIQRKYIINDTIQAEINRALLVTVVNKYPKILNRLKDAIEVNAHILNKNESVITFYNKWLDDPVLTLDKEIVNLLSNDQIDEIKNDLVAIKL